MKVYISGKVTGLDLEQAKENFRKAEEKLNGQGHATMSPAALFGNKGFEHSDYMHICYAMIDVCDALFLQANWQDSKGARMERSYALEWRKEIIYEDESTRE